MDGETIYGIIHMLFMIAGGYFLTESDRILEAKHYSSWWLILVWIIYFPFPYISVIVWVITKNLDENITFENPD